MRFLLLIFLVCAFAFAENTDKPGTAAQIIRKTPLRSGPSETSEPVGDMAKGTIVILQGERQNGYAHIVVEIEGSPQVEGWVKVEDLNYRARENIKVEEDLDDEDAPPPAAPKSAPPKPEPLHQKTTKVPKDEAILFSRESSFLYGLEAGGNFFIMQPATGTYLGPGFQGAAEFGYYATREILIRGQLGYTAGYTTASDGTGLQLSFADATILGSYLIMRFEVFAGLQYAYTVGVTDAPKSLQKTSIDSFSNFYALVGGGYHFHITDYAELALRIRYGISFFADPVAYQMFSGLVAIEIKG